MAVPRWSGEGDNGKEVYLASMLNNNTKTMLIILHCLFQSGICDHLENTKSTRPKEQ